MSYLGCYRLGRRVFGVTTAALICAHALPAFALELINKPDPANSGDEFGASVDRNNFYTLVGADELDPLNPVMGQVIFTSQDNGALYVMNDYGTGYAYKYQYLHDPEEIRVRYNIPAGNPINFNPTKARLGSNVATSNRWIVSTMNYFPETGGGEHPALFALDKTQSSIPNCSVPFDSNNDGVNDTSIVDCTNVIEPILLNSKITTVSRGQVQLAASDKHIALASTPDRAVLVLSPNGNTQTFQASEHIFENIPGTGRLDVDITDEGIVITTMGTTSNSSDAKLFLSIYNASTQS